MQIAEQNKVNYLEDLLSEIRSELSDANIQMAAKSNKQVTQAHKIHSCQVKTILNMIHHLKVEEDMY